MLLIFFVLLFFQLLNKFYEMEGMKYPLLKTIVGLILILFFLIMWRYKKEIKEILWLDKDQKKLDEYFK